MTVDGAAADDAKKAGMPAFGSMMRRSGVIDTGKPTREEVVTAAPGGPTEYFDLSVEPLSDEACGIIGVICAATDITERKKAEQALQISDAG
jgi:PAS domain S-box-containing protein